MNAPSRNALSRFEANCAINVSFHVTRSVEVLTVARASLFGIGVVSYRLSWYRTATWPFWFTETHGKNWSLLFTVPGALSWFTCMGWVHVVPWLSDLMMNTSLSVMSPFGHA